MEDEISGLVERFERGALSRRDLVAGLTAIAAAGASAPAAAQTTPFVSTGIDHISVQVTNLDRSIAWTIQQLREHWGATLSPTAQWQDWYGNDLADPVGEVWLQHAKPAVRLVAAAAYARSPLGRTALPLLLDLLLDDYPHVRMFALFAIEGIVGRRLDAREYTPTASHEDRQQQVDALRSHL